MRRRHGRSGALARTLLFPAAFAAAVLILLAAVSNLRAGSGAEGKKRLEDAVRRSAVTCYATEGFYPPSVEYLERHYGLQIDKKHYTVRYSVFAENLMPDITVLDNAD